MSYRQKFNKQHKLTLIKSTVSTQRWIGNDWNRMEEAGKMCSFDWMMMGKYVFNKQRTAWLSLDNHHIDENGNYNNSVVMNTLMYGVSWDILGPSHDTDEES